MLIVIALLGALAVGLLAAVDPFEQLKKGTDTSRRNTVAEFYNAAIRYYAVNSAFPWGTASQPSGTPLADPNYGFSGIGNLETSGELKQNFSNLAGGVNALNQMYVTAVTSAGTTQVIVCFLPASKSFQFDQNTRYDDAGNTTNQTQCKSQSGPSSCYWCIQ